MRRYFTFGRLWVIAASFILFTGCKTVKIIEQVPVEVHDTTYLNKVVHDSIHIDHFREVTKMMNDTVYVLDSFSVVKYRLITDTAYKYIERPVTLTRTETVEVEKPLTGRQKFQIHGFWWLAVGLLGFVLWHTRKWWGKFIKFVKV